MRSKLLIALIALVATAAIGQNDKKPVKRPTSAEGGPTKVTGDPTRTVSGLSIGILR